MYTQCDKCKAIFEVSMREITVASGKIRCSECNAVFDAMSSLTTTMPEPFREEPDIHGTAGDTLKVVENSLAKPSINNRYRPVISKPGVTEIAQNLNYKWLKRIAISLVILLFAQILYNNRHFITGQPLHEPEKIEMLNNNVFAHPNEKGVLLISASIENHAEHAQPYPYLEVRLTDSESRLIALQRFKPSEYLENYHDKMLLEVNKPINLKLKIADPGNDATRFQFKFL